MPSMTALRTYAMYIPLVTGSLSIMGSSSILLSIWFRRERLKDPQHRILGMMSIFDVLCSFSAASKGLTYPSGSGVPTLGNQATCTFQGFLFQFGFASGTYNLVLSVYYYLTINRGWKQRDFARRVEKFLHAFVVCFHLGAAITGASIGLFNQSSVFCYIAPHPYGCAAEPETCERFGTSYIYFIEAFGQFWIQLAYVVIFFSNLGIWLHVRKQEKAMQRYAVHSPIQRQSTRKTKHARNVLIQSSLYVGAFVLTWSWTTVYSLIILIGGNVKFWPVIPIATFVPMQGFWNAFVYARPRYLRMKKKIGGRPTFLQAFRLVFFPPKPGADSHQKSGRTTVGARSPAQISRPTGCTQETVVGEGFVENEGNDHDSIDYCSDDSSEVCTNEVLHP